MKLHATAIYLLRAARADDPETGLSPARLSALSVVTFAGPLTISSLARQEQVTRAAMSQTVSRLQADGLVRRRRDMEDGRRVLLEVTPKGKSLMLAARGQRVKRIRAMLERMPEGDRRALGRGLLGLTRQLAASPG